MKGKVFIIHNEVFLQVFIITFVEFNIEKVAKQCILKKANVSADVIKHIHKTISEEKRAGAKWIAHNDAPQFSFIHLYKWDGNAADYGALQHEIFHAVDNALRDKGFNLSDDSDEAFAYCIGHLTREIYNKMWK